MRIFIAFIIALFAAAVPVTAQDGMTPIDKALTSPLFEPAIDYADIPRIENCKEKVPEARLRYHACRESKAVYEAALASAKAKDQALMVIFGFNTCPACLSMERTLFRDDSPIENQDIVAFFSENEVENYIAAQTQDSLSPMKISMVRLHGRSEHGQQLAHDLGLTDIAKSRGWHRVWSPFIVFVNPKTGKMHTESYWDPETRYCNWMAEFAASLQGIEMIDDGKPYRERKRCKA